MIDELTLAALIKRHGVAVEPGLFVLRIPDSDLVEAGGLTVVQHNPFEHCTVVSVIEKAYTFHPDHQLKEYK